MSNKLRVGRIAFGSSKDADGSALEKALKTLRNPAPGVTLVSHGWVKPCNICKKQTHAKWHEESNGEIINPIALLEYIDLLPATKEAEAIRNWITTITGITKPRAGTV